MTVQDNQYVTRDELAARLAELKLRIVVRMDDHFRQQTRWLLTAILPIYGLLLAMTLGIGVALLNIYSRLPVPSS